jgi:hypothetical protein
VIKAKCGPYLVRGKPARQPSTYHLDDHTLVNIYGSRYRGIVNYYLLAGDVFRLNRLHWAVDPSLGHSGIEPSMTAAVFTHQRQLGQ